MTSFVLSAQKNAEARARITARLRSAGNKELVAHKNEQAQSLRTKPVLPKFREEAQGRVARFVAHAQALSCQFLACQFLAEGEVAQEKFLGKILQAFFEEQGAKKGAKKSEKATPKIATKIATKIVAKTATLPVLLFASAEQPLLTKLNILQSLESCCRPSELGESIVGEDFVRTPFPAFSLQHAACAIAETGSLVFTNRTRAQAIVTFLPTTHLVLLDEGDIVDSLEQAFARTYPSSSKSPIWACHVVSGPSRTADIEQTLQMGAHGPKKLLILLYR